MQWLILWGYSYTSDFTQASASIYACNPDSEGNPSHFVNDIGNGQYYDSWTGQTGNVIMYDRDWKF